MVRMTHPTILVFNCHFAGQRKKAAQAAFFLCVRNNGSGSFRARFVVFLVELLNASGSVHDFLCSGIERVALGTDFNVQYRLAYSGLGLECVAAAAGYCDLGILRVYVGFHLGFPSISYWCGKRVRTHEGADYP